MPLPAGYMFAQKFAAWLAFLCLACCGASAQSDLRTAVSFRNDVMAVLSKAGCNAGTCHGNKNGKGGFKLSLRGQDPDADYLTLTRDSLARRLNPLEPEESLILLKPTMAVAHGGQILCSRATVEVAGDGFPVRSLGAHRLRGLAAPQELFQVGGGVFPPLPQAGTTRLPRSVPPHSMLAGAGSSA